MPSLTFPARFEFLDQIREFVAEIARENGFNEKEIYSLQLAADEAATNVIEHAYADTSDAVFEFGCDVQEDALVITLHDRGKSFDISKVKEPNVTADLNERQIGGLGIYLMRKLMDKVEYHSDATGNLLTMTKHKG
jgi:anti-sigma regulatory factor (Ser/Thr protein kinase)